jgi:hypothetical protein
VGATRKRWRCHASLVLRCPGLRHGCCPRKMRIRLEGEHDFEFICSLLCLI